MICTEENGDLPHQSKHSHAVCMLFFATTTKKEREETASVDEAGIVG